jgi:hypothetical protein
MRTSLQEDGLTESRLRTALFWLACTGITGAIYWLCLRFLYPAYFAPLSPFHVDFYVYAAAREQSFRTLLFTYPRPAAYLALKILSLRGLTSLMGGGVAIALIDVLLTLALVRRMLRLDTPWLPATYAVYAFLLFAHPQFYIEHRHDLPAEISWFFLAVSLLAWMAWVERRHAATLAVAVIASVFFAFAKETYFISALILVLGMAIANRSERRLHLAFLAFLVMIEFASFAWTSHINSPFVNVNADAASTYHISAAPGSVARTFWFYLAQLLNPWLVAIAAAGLVMVSNDRRRLFLDIALLLAGLAAFATLAVLPNHKFEEYAWAAAPLFLAPVLSLCSPESLRWKAAQPALLVFLSVLAIAGPAGYHREYGTDAGRYWIAQDRRGAAVWHSLERLRAVPPPARILISGLDDPQQPWQLKEFVQREFGDLIHWTMALPPAVQYRHGSSLVSFVNAADVRFSDYDYLAKYHADGRLVEVQEVKNIPVGADPEETMLPDLADAVAAAHQWPREYKPVLQCAEICVDWGFLRAADHFLDQVNVADPCDGTFQQLSFDIRNRLQQAETARVATSTIQGRLTARPAPGVAPDKSGLGVAELTWSAPAGVSAEIRVGAPNGALFAAGGNSGHAVTQKWVKDGMPFFLQDVTGGKARTSENTLAVVKVDAHFSGDSGAETPGAAAQPAARAELVANPSHIAQPDHSGLGSTQLTWRAPAGRAVEIHVCSPRGTLLASGGSTGQAATQKWVTNGMQFFLQDVTGGKPLTSENTLAVSRVEVTP